MSAALSTTGRLCANLGQTLWWLLFVLASPMVEGASLLPSLRFVEPHCHPTDVRATLAFSASPYEPYTKDVSIKVIGSNDGTLGKRYRFW